MAKQIKYRGDRTGSIRAGDVLGPDVHGQHHRVTTVRFEHPYTHVETRRIPTEGQRVRYFGGRGSRTTTTNTYPTKCRPSKP